MMDPTVASRGEVRHALRISRARHVLACRETLCFDRRRAGQRLPILRSSHSAAIPRTPRPEPSGIRRRRSPGVQEAARRLARAINRARSRATHSGGAVAREESRWARGRRGPGGPRGKLFPMTSPRQGVPFRAPPGEWGRIWGAETSRISPRDEVPDRYVSGLRVENSPLAPGRPRHANLVAGCTAQNVVSGIRSYRAAPEQSDGLWRTTPSQDRTRQ